LIFAIPLIFMSFFGIEVDWPEDINMTAMVGNLFLGAFCLLVAWRVYVDYFKKK
jgi:membrane protein CcdC involved in cytochrome C biogenesis